MTKSLPTEKCSSLCAPGEQCALTEHGQCQEQPQSVAWMTYDYNGNPMLWRTYHEALQYCEDDENPIPLYAAPTNREAQITELQAELAIVKTQCADWLDEAASDIIDWGQNASQFTRFMFGFDDTVRLHQTRAADLRNAARGKVEMTEKGNDDAAEPPLACRVMPLRWGQLMLVYVEFDRNADKTWTDTEYLLKFGEAVSEATVGVIRRGMGHNA